LRPTCGICHLLYIKLLSFVCGTILKDTNSIAFAVVGVAGGRMFVSS
jgi:hypothetical protein